MKKHPLNCSPRNHEPNGSADDMDFLMAYDSLTPDLVAELEKKAAAQPADLRTRLLLLGYYRDNFDNPELVTAGMKHVMWMIDNRPSDYVCYYLDLVAGYSQRQYEELRELWLQKIRLHPTDDRIVGNFANAVCGRDGALSLECFRQAQQLNAQEPRWTRRLAQIYGHEAMNDKAEERAKYAELCVLETEKALRLNDTRGEYIGLLMCQPAVAIEFNFLAQARAWSEELLAGSRSGPFRLWPQTAWLYLARIELLEGKNAKSKALLKRVLRSIKFEETSHIVYSPRMLALLKDLLSFGERAAVIDSLTVCHARCPVNYAKEQEMRIKLQEWLSLVRNGETPDFFESGLRQ